MSYREIGAVIRAKRKAKGITIKQLAEACGSCETSIYKLETGKRSSVEWGEMCRIEKILNISFTRPEPFDNIAQSICS